MDNDSRIKYFCKELDILCKKHKIRINSSQIHVLNDEDVEGIEDHNTFKIIKSKNRCWQE